MGRGRDGPVGEEDASTLGEFIPDERSGPSEDVAVSLRDQALRNAMPMLESNCESLSLP